MDTTQTTPKEGDEEKATPAPTPEPVMQDQDSAPKADPETQEAPPQETPATISVEELGETVGREFDSPEEAKKWAKNVNSLVGDQTRARKDKALEKLAGQANLSVPELLEVIDTQPMNQPQEQQQAPTQQTPPDTANLRVTRLEVDRLVDKQPEAKAVKDTLFAEAVSTGKSVADIWDEKYAPVLEAGKKVGRKKLQSNLEGQPTKAASTASESTDTKISFKGNNPETGKKWTAEEMEKHLHFTQPSSRL